MSCTGRTRRGVSSPILPLPHIIRYDRLIILSYFYKRIIPMVVWWCSSMIDVSSIRTFVLAGVSTAVNCKQNCDDTAETLSDTHLVFSALSSPILGIPVNQQYVEQQSIAAGLSYNRVQQYWLHHETSRRTSSAYIPECYTYTATTLCTTGR